MSGNKYLSNVVWRMLESFGAQGVTFVVSIILARVLDPAAYGVVAIVAVFTSLCNIFVDGGFGMALIQKKDADDLDFSSVFYFNMVTCIVLYLALFFCAPLIASLYNLPELTNVIRVQGCVLVVSGVKSVQTAYVSRRMIFKKFFFATLGGTLGAAARHAAFLRA